MKKKPVYTFPYNNRFFIFVILMLEMKFSFEKLINNIIELGGAGFRFSHFSLNSQGDMIIDTTAFPGNNERRFYGLKKNGRPYFFNENNIETPYRSLFAEGLQNTNQQKTEGESNFIILSKQSDTILREYLLSFSKFDNYMELYDFDNNVIYYENATKLFKNAILSEVSTFIKAKSRIDNNYNYYMAYNHFDSSNNLYRLYVLRCYFTSTNLNNKGYHFDTGSRKSIINKAISSCFETELNKVACFYQNYKNSQFYIVTLNAVPFNESYYTILEDIPSHDYNLFFKSIHFKKEIGIFIYFLTNCSTPIISFKYCKEDNLFENYKNLGLINVSKISFNTNATLNDIIKLNDNKILYISCSEDKKLLFLVILNLYDNDNYIMIRYYSYNMFNENCIKFFKEIRGFSFNNYISLAFSHCSKESCSEDSDEHFSSLIIFNYPNSPDDQSVDLISYIYSTNNQIENFSFILDENINCNIDNNIFNYTYKGIRILDYPENTNLIYKKNNQVVEKNSSLEEKEYLSLIFQSNEEYIGMNYSIEYAFVIKEPEYSKINDYITYKDDLFGNNYEQNYYKQEEYIGKTAFFNITIKEDLISSCNDKCTLCYRRDINLCTICKYNYTFNEEEKICFTNPLLKTTIPITTSISTSLKTSILHSQSTLPKSTSISTSLKTSILHSQSTLPKSTSITTTINTSILHSQSTLPKSTSISTSINTSILHSQSTLPKSTSISTSIKSSLISSSTLSSSSIIMHPSLNKLSSLISIITRSSSLSAFEGEKSTTLSSSSLLKKQLKSTFSLFSSLMSSNPVMKNSLTSTSSLKSTIQTNKLLISNSIKVEDLKCTKQQIIDGKCSDNISNEQIGEIYDYIKDNIIKNNSKNNTIIETKNVVFQVSTIGQQKDNQINISSIDLGECENLIKKKENIDDEDELIIFKTDNRNFDLSLTYVQYEIYNPYTLELIPLDICENISIIIKTPVNLDTDLESIYKYLNSSGYNLFDLNDSFYSDICSTYTTENGTDMSMLDRKNIIYDSYKNVSLCQPNCTFLFYNSTNKKSECKCEVQTEETVTDIDALTFDEKEFFDNFYTTLENSNFLVLKCFKLVFSYEGFINNYGCYIISSLFFIIIISFFRYCIKGRKSIDKYILELVQKKLLLNYDKINNITDINLKEKKQRIKKKSLTVIKKKKNSKSIQINNNNINIFINNKNKKRNIFNSYPPKRKKNESRNRRKKINESLLLSSQQMKNSMSNQTNSKFLKEKKLLNKRYTDFLLNKNKRKNVKNNSNNIKKKSILLKSFSNNYNNKNKKYNNINHNKNNTKIYNDVEMNQLDYEEALKIDSRTFFQYYNSLIHIKQIILFTFFRNNDYNLLHIKICLFLFSFSIYFTLNGFFFSDKTMNKIYEDNGQYDILFQIPQIIYSSCLSTIINMLLKRLALTENELLSLKHEKNNNIIENATKIRKYLKNKIYFFFIIGILNMVFFWYFISCFCAVYKNTQLILILDSLFSFCFTMVYPFALYLLPGIFRITALRSSKKDKKCLYFLGNIISLI